MATFVVVHGAFGGGWEWREVAGLLRARGHEVFTPTLTGFGERIHLATPEMPLETHIQDVTNLLRYEDLHEVVLACQSYGGMKVTGVADLMRPFAERARSDPRWRLHVLEAIPDAHIVMPEKVAEPFDAAARSL